MIQAKMRGWGLVGAVLWAGCSLGCSAQTDGAAANEVGVSRQALESDWPPADLPLLARYVAAPNSVHLTTSGVLQWDDVSGNGRHARCDFAPAQPQFVANGWDGVDRPTLRFEGGDLMRLESWTGIPEGTEKGFTVLAVMRSKNPQNAAVASWWNQGGGFVWAELSTSNQQTFLGLQRVDGLFQGQAHSSPYDLGSIGHVVAWRYSPESHTIKLTVDGTTTSESSPPIGALPSMPFIIGANTLLPTGIFKGDISELAIVGDDLEDEEVLEFTAYARATWHALPSGGPQNSCLDANGQPVSSNTRCDDDDPDTFGDHCAAGTCTGTLPPSGSPAELSPVAWYRASETDVLVREGRVAKWFDRTQNHVNLAQAFTWGRPTLGDWDGKPTVRFNGGNLLRFDDWTGMPLGEGAAFTLAVVFKSSASAQNSSVAAWWDPISYSKVALGLRPSSGTTVVDLLRVDGFNTTQHLASATDVGSDRHVAVWRYSPETIKLTLDGRTTTASNLGPVGSVTAKAFLVGASTHLASGLFTGDIAELAVLSSSISDDDVALLNEYAHNEWGVNICTPSCAGAACGASDGCGSSCACEEGEACESDDDCNAGLACTSGECAQPPVWSLAGFGLVAAGAVTIAENAIVKQSIAVHANPTDGTSSITIGRFARVAEGKEILAKSVYVRSGARVGVVRAEKLFVENGAIVGAWKPYSTPPEPVDLSPFVPDTLGNPPFSVAGGQVIDLPPGSYGDLHVQGTLRLLGGRYDFNSFDLGQQSLVEALAPVSIAVRNTGTVGAGARILPQSGDVRDVEIAIFGRDPPSSPNLPDLHVYGDGVVHGSVWAQLGGNVLLEPGGKILAGVAGGKVKLGDGARIGPEDIGPRVAGVCTEEQESTGECEGELDTRCSSAKVCLGSECRLLRHLEDGAECDANAHCEVGRCLCDEWYGPPGDRSGDCSSLTDSDEDEVPDLDDNCDGTANPEQHDIDYDGVGDICDGPRIYVTDGTHELLNDEAATRSTFALAASNGALGDLDTSHSGGHASLTAGIWEGQELVVFNARYGYGPLDPGGAAQFLPYLHPNGWLFVDSLRYSSVVVPLGETLSFDYPHEARHIVRYTHGTCSKRVPLQPIFEEIAYNLNWAYFCNARKEIESRSAWVENLVRVDRIHQKIQPHFRGDFVNLSGGPDTEMGFFINAHFEISSTVPPAELVDIKLNPSFAVRLGADGVVRVELLSDSNVFANSIGGMDTGLIERAIQDFPARFDQKFRDAVPALTGELAVSCDAAAAPSASRVTCREGLDDYCDHPSEEYRNLCLIYRLGRDKNEIGNEHFVCRTDNLCALRPKVQQVNVLPTDLELVFAPDFSELNPDGELDANLRRLQDELIRLDPYTELICDSPAAPGIYYNQTPAQVNQGQHRFDLDAAPPVDCALYVEE